MIDDASTESLAFADTWDLERTVDFITAGQHRCVSLQFPDGLLSHAPRVAAAIKSRCPPGLQVAVLADSAFHPESVDEVAASHIASTCIVHYGAASLATNSATPILHVFAKSRLDCSACAAALDNALQSVDDLDGAERSVIVFLDQALLHCGSRLLTALQATSLQLRGWHVFLAEPTQHSPQTAVTLQSDISGSQAASMSFCHRDEAAGYSWRRYSDTEKPLCCWVGGQDGSALLALQVSLCTHRWLRIHVDMTTGVVHGPAERDITVACQHLIKRRRYVLEKARNASLVGILLGTLSSDDVKKALSHLRALILASGKHSYTVVVGKPNPAKLANFSEVEVWVQLSDPLGAILDSREYLAPIITPQEAVLAFTGQVLTADTPLRLGLDPLLSVDGDHVSTLAMNNTDLREASDDVALVPTGGTQILAKGGVQHLQSRSWQGLEAPVAGGVFKAPAAAVQGLSGRAAGYTDELKSRTPTVAVTSDSPP